MLREEGIPPSLPEFVTGAKEGRSETGMGTAKLGIGIAAVGVAETAIFPPAGALTIAAGLSMATIGGMVNYLDNMIAQMRDYEGS